MKWIEKLIYVRNLLMRNLKGYKSFSQLVSWYYDFMLSNPWTWIMYWHGTSVFMLCFSIFLTIIVERLFSCSLRQNHWILNFSSWSENVDALFWFYSLRILEFHYIYFILIYNFGKKTSLNGIVALFSLFCYIL